MPTCEWCGKHYNADEEEMLFEYDINFDYTSMRKNLCADCAMQAVDEEVDGVFADRCESCGKKFDPILENAEYGRHFSDCNGTDLSDVWMDAGEILCAECGLEYVESHWNG